MPPPREIRLFTADELERIAAELVQVAAAAVRFAAATGLRPRSGPRVERRDVDKARRIINVRGTKTLRSRREVPLTRAALDALEQVPPRLDSRHVFTTSRKCPGRVSLARSTSPTSDAASGPPRSTRPAWPSGLGCTTSAPRSPRTLSRPGSRCSSSLGSRAPVPR